MDAKVGLNSWAGRVAAARSAKAPPRTASVKAMPRSVYCPWDPAKVKARLVLVTLNTPCNLLADRAIKPKVTHKPDGQVGNSQAQFAVIVLLRKP